MFEFYSLSETLNKSYHSHERIDGTKQWYEIAIKGTITWSRKADYVEWGEIQYGSLLVHRLTLTMFGVTF